jgi:hypothetical protein
LIHNASIAIAIGDSRREQNLIDADGVVGFNYQYNF